VGTIRVSIFVFKDKWNKKFIEQQRKEK